MRQTRLSRHLFVTNGGEPDPQLADHRDIEGYLSHLALPWKSDGETVIYASASDSPSLRKWLRARHGANAWVVAADKSVLVNAIETRFRSRFARDAALKLALAEPGLSAQRVILRSQAAVFAALAAALIASLCFFPYGTAIALTLLLALGFIANVAFRALLVCIGAAEYPPSGPLPLDENLPPPYTILVPMYHEANMVPQIVAALNGLDYPADKLQIIFALERDDKETYDVLSRVTLDRSYQIVRVPPGKPRTKPRACNYALNFARGEFLVIYDAEDRPEPDQLKKAVAAFRANPDDVACFQARLNFYNARRNWLTCGVMAQTPQA